MWETKLKQTTYINTVLEVDVWVSLILEVDVWVSLKLYSNVTKDATGPATKGRTDHTGNWTHKKKAKGANEEGKNIHTWCTQPKDDETKSRGKHDQCPLR